MCDFYNKYNYTLKGFFIDKKYYVCRAKNWNMKTISNTVIKLIYIKQLLCFFYNYYILWGSFTNMCDMLKTFTSKQISNGAIIYIKQYLWYFLQLLQVYFGEKKTVPKTWIWKQYLMAPWYILNSKCDFFTTISTIFCECLL